MRIYEGFLRGRPVAPPHDRRGQRARGRRRHEPGPGVRRPPGRPSRPASTRGSCSSASTPAAAHTWMLAASLGPQAAAAIVLFGEVLDGRERRALGLVWRCVPDDAAAGRRARELAARAAVAPAELLAAEGATIAAHGHDRRPRRGRRRELDDQLWSMDQPEFAGALAALRRADLGRLTPARPAVSAQAAAPAQSTHAASSSSPRSSHSSAVMA